MTLMKSFPLDLTEIPLMYASTYFASEKRTGSKLVSPNLLIQVRWMAQLALESEP